MFGSEGLAASGSSIGMRAFGGSRIRVLPDGDGGDVAICVLVNDLRIDAEAAAEVERKAVGWLSGTLAFHAENAGEAPFAPRDRVPRTPPAGVRKSVA